MKRRALAVVSVLLLAATPLFAGPGVAKPKPPKPPKPHAAASKPPKPVKVTAPKPVKATAPKPVKATAATPGGTVRLTKVQQQLTKNTNLAAKMQARLPAGTDLMKAADGFKNLGQFVAAVNNSYNHQIPFYQLKRKMVNEGMSLGQAKQSLKASSGGTQVHQ